LAAANGNAAMTPRSSAAICYLCIEDTPAASAASVGPRRQQAGPTSVPRKIPKRATAGLARLIGAADALDSDGA
jgi:hypothetical protein